MIRRDYDSDTEFMSFIAVLIPTINMTIIQPHTYRVLTVFDFHCGLFDPTMGGARLDDGSRSAYRELLNSW